MKRAKYVTLYLSLREGIVSGKFAPGKKLPSKREMAEQSGYSPVTVEHAYAMLEDEGFLVAKERRGYFVAPLSAISRTVDPAVREASHLPEPKGDGAGLLPDLSVFFKTFRRVLSSRGASLFEKSHPCGVAALRNAIADDLYRRRGISVAPKNIVVGSGAESLYESIVFLLGKDKIYAVEDPCYQAISTVYSLLGVEVCPLKMSSDGIRTEEIQTKWYDVLHVTPFHSFPSGVTTGAAKRALYLDEITKRGGYLIEDDFDSEFSRSGVPIATIFSQDRAGRVIYVNTFTKTLSPSMRIGYMILPDALLSVYEERLGALSCSVPVIDQYLLAELLSSGEFERHVNRMRKARKEKQSPV